MQHLIKKHSAKIGLSPGSFVHVGKKKIDKINISIIDYSEKHLEKRTLEKVEETFPYKNSATVSWINIGGLHDVETIRMISEHFDIHPLVIEDILSTPQRPKIEFFDNYIFIILQMLSYNTKTHHIDSEQISIIQGENFVITFQENEGDIFDPLRQRIDGGKGRIRNSGADYLAYTLMDIIVDNYFLILETLGAEIEKLDESVLKKSPDTSLVQKVYKLKKELLFLRKCTWPLREVVSNLQCEETALFQKSTARFVNDLYDHTLQVIDVVEVHRETIADILELHLSLMSNRVTEVMKVLTMIATIFIPLSFLAGVYGMNFNTASSPFNMPELNYRFGYLIFWALTLAIVGSLLIYFRKKNWL